MGRRGAFENLSGGVGLMDEDIWMECDCAMSTFWHCDNCVSPEMIKKGWHCGKSKEDY